MILAIEEKGSCSILHCQSSDTNGGHLEFLCSEMIQISFSFQRQLNKSQSKINNAIQLDNASLRKLG